MKLMIVSDPIYLRLSEIVAREVEASGLMLLPSTEFDDVPGWDSLSMVGVLIEVERHFGVRVPPAAADECRRVEELVNLIRIHTP